nr:hypothetical protein [uncultured Acidocella sp.]
MESSACHKACADRQDNFAVQQKRRKMNNLQKFWAEAAKVLTLRSSDGRPQEGPLFSKSGEKHLGLKKSAVKP